ncbi:hypothetical protein VTN02DRAFT_4478 [Thermoascus thermophilus]
MLAQTVIPGFSAVADSSRGSAPTRAPKQGLARASREPRSHLRFSTSTSIYGPFITLPNLVVQVLTGSQPPKSHLS